jgi:hypothetical protein
MAHPHARPTLAYAPRDPEQTLLHQVMRKHLPAFLARTAASDRPLPRLVTRELDDFLRCGVLRHGFLRLRDLVITDRPDLDAAADRPAASPSVAAPPATGPCRPRHLRWAQLLRRVFHFDLERRPRCNGRLRLLAAILDPHIAQAILVCLPSPSRAPPLDSHALAQQPF